MFQVDVEHAATHLSITSLMPGVRIRELVFEPESRLFLASTLQGEWGSGARKTPAIVAIDPRSPQDAIKIFAPPSFSSPTSSRCSSSGSREVGRIVVPALGPWDLAGRAPVFATHGPDTICLWDIRVSSPIQALEDIPAASSYFAMTASGSHLVGVVDALDPLRHATPETTTITSIDVATGSVVGERVLSGAHKRVAGLAVFPDVVVIKRSGVGGLGVSEHALYRDSQP